MTYRSSRLPPGDGSRFTGERRMAESERARRLRQLAERLEEMRRYL
jgi:hypothetical protein